MLESFHANTPSQPGRAAGATTESAPSCTGEAQSCPAPNRALSPVHGDHDHEERTVQRAKYAPWPPAGKKHHSRQKHFNRLDLRCPLRPTSPHQNILSGNKTRDNLHPIHTNTPTDGEVVRARCLPNQQCPPIARLLPGRGGQRSGI